MAIEILKVNLASEGESREISRKEVEARLNLLMPHYYCGSNYPNFIIELISLFIV